MGNDRPKKPLRIINSVAPIRICDNGGWTDTWFARFGKIFNIGVYPQVEVQINLYPYRGQEERIIIEAENYGERYVFHSQQPHWGPHPLLEAAIKRVNLPPEVAFQVTIFSDAPAGASTGTSAAVAVAMLGALDQLTPGRLSKHELAYLAQSIEVDLLKRQSGIQDQLCSAYGGLNYIEMVDYPHCLVSQLQVAGPIWWELDRRLVLIYLGKSHDSSQVHQQVIKELEDAGPDCQQLNDLRATAAQSRDAVYAGDFEALGGAMRRNTEAQGRLHADLISADARRVIEMAQAHAALGWKVNGAGGEGGSITILCNADSPAKRLMIREIEAENPLYQNIPVSLSRDGLRVWESAPI